MAKPFSVAAQSDAGSAEAKAFFEALDEERRRSPKDFADS
jgi:hypothetical protein